MSQLYRDGLGFTSKRTRDRMVERLQAQGIRDPRVLSVMGETPRHWFLDEALANRAYEDTSLPIGYGQTLSQPYIVARMTELLLSAGACKHVLEVGTGSGYQTAVLAQLCERVWSVERIKPLQDKARERVYQLKRYNVRYKHADGGFGWPEHGPFDGILSTAAPEVIPPELLAQLAPGGSLVIPVGRGEQFLTLVTRDRETERFTERKIEPVRFVPLLSGITN